ncbi:uncharacterized protein LOC110671018 isoform X2 [Hevea brasiliensis]|uniref:uncharacterized protein LOC110671018 isoform X2 n=1 Tax=Hevea brasiliensis TaxID=3981 RepID=UPI0025CFEE21|nr:uncharacterized protein LOC110671018 isoform X2 [Hevea brasiliensis]
MSLEEDGDELQDLMPKIMEDLKIFEGRVVFNKNEENYAQKALEDLIEATKDRPDLLLNWIDEIFECMYKILKNQNFNERTRFLATEIVAQIFSNFREPEAVPYHTGRFISQIFSMLKAIDDYPAWDEKKLEKNWSLHFQGKKRLARFAPAMGGQFLLKKFSAMFESHYNSDEWQSRHAAVVSNVIIACACSKELINKLDLVVEPAMKAVEDAHFHVRWAALNAIEEFSKKLNPGFQHQYYNQVLPPLIKASNYFQNPRIQLQAVKALSYFAQHCNSDLLTPYIDEIVNMLLRCLQRGPQVLNEAALMGLASLAASLKDSFQEYYGTVMPYMKVIMMKAAEGSNFTLLAQSVDCITLVGLSVEKEMINDYFQMVLQLLISSKASKIGTGHPMRNQLLKAWGSLCKCLGQDFQPYLGVAIPLLLQSAQLASHVTSLKVSESKHSFESIVTLQDQISEIKSEVLEEKATACKVLCICADELKEGFNLWTDEAAQTLVPLINYDIHEELRTISISAMPVILKSSKAAMEKECTEGSDDSSFKKLSSYITPALVEALNKEKLTEIQVRILESLNECMEAFGCLTTFTKAYKTSLSQFFDQLLSCMAYMWENDRKAEERRTALHIFSDVAEKCQEEALRYCENSLQFLFDACCEKNPEVQQTVAQGIGVSAEFGGSIFKSHIKEALAGLNAIMRDQETLHLDYLLAHDAAVSALGKICLCHYERLDEVFGIWLSHLPIVNDLDEAKVAHDRLCSMVEKFKEELISRNDTHLSKIFEVFAEILWVADDLATEATFKQVIELLKHFKSKLPPDTWTSIISSLIPSRAKILQHLMSS